MPEAGEPPPELTGALVRQVLLGLHGPYADARVAINALDNVETLVAELEVDRVVELAEVLLDLATDPDAVVATGAVLGLERVRQRGPATEAFVAVVGRMIDLVLAGGVALQRAPIGFAGASQGTLRAELAVIAAGSASFTSIAGVSLLVGQASEIGVPRVDLVAALAERLPAVVVAHARGWVGPHDSAVVARLREHHRRIAVATAARPWDEAAIRAIEMAGQWQRWHEAEIEAVLRVMRDEAPELTAPSGVGDVDLGGRWWIVAERPWDWTLWRSDDGRAVLEKVEGGVGAWTSVRDLSGDRADAIVATTIAGEDLTGREIAKRYPGGP